MFKQIKTLSMTCFILGTSPVFASMKIDQELTSGRQNMRTTMNEIREVIKGQNVTNKTKEQLLNLYKEIESNYEALEFFALKATKEKIKENGIKIMPLKQGLPIIEFTPPKPFYELNRAEINLVIKNLNTYVKLSNTIKERHYKILNTSTIVADKVTKELKNKDIVVDIEKDFYSLIKVNVKKVRLDLANELGLMVNYDSNTKEYSWDQAHLVKKTGYASFDKMPIELREKINKSLDKLINDLRYMNYQFNHIEVFKDEEFKFIMESAYYMGL